MNPALFQIPFVQIALPVVFTILIAAWMNGKTFDTLNKRLDDQSRLIEATGKMITADLKLEIQRVEARVKSLEERAWLICRP